MISKNVDNIIEFIYNSTTNEEKLALNEIINNLLLDNNSTQNCIYWYLWLEKLNSSKTPQKVNISFLEGEEEGEYYDKWFSIIWKIIFKFEDTLDKKNIIYIKKLHKLYYENFKLSQVKNRKYYIFIAFYVLKNNNNINWNINIYIQEHLIIQTTANINKMYYNIIKNFETNLDSNARTTLIKNYYKSLNNINNNIESSKKKKKSVDIELNKVKFTYHPEYDCIKNNNKDLNELNLNELNLNELNLNELNPLISKNMTERDVLEEKEKMSDKKLSAFSNFLSYKAKKPEHNKNVIEYFSNDNNDSSINIKEIIINKKNK